MYIFIIILIFVASLLVVLAVLAQNPKSGMAANFGASNAVMGVRQTADFLEKLTWGLAIAIVVLSLAATMAMPSNEITRSNELLKQEALDKNPSGMNNTFMLPENAEAAPATTEGTGATQTPATTPAEEPQTTPAQ